MTTDDTTTGGPAADGPERPPRRRTRSRNRRRRERAASPDPTESAGPVGAGPPLEQRPAHDRPAGATLPEGVTPLREPADGTPPVIDDRHRLIDYAQTLAGSDEPIALDAERASSYRYSARAYLLQLRTEHAGTALIDPLAFPGGSSSLRAALEGREWVLHAATQDLPSLREFGLEPTRLFDTELAARLLGMPQVGLGAVVEDTVGLRLKKEFSAVDWSTRPLPPEWLVYAALDVEVLVTVRDVLAARLRAAGKAEWARQEFDALLHFRAPDYGVDAWRRTRGVSKARSPRTLGIVRAFWQRRDELAREQDLSPHRVLRDSAMLAVAQADPQSETELRAVLPRRTRDVAGWWEAVAEVRRMPESHLPRRASKPGAQNHRSWARKHPELAQTYQVVRADLEQRATELDLPQENLMVPRVLREYLWERRDAAGPPSTTEVSEALLSLGARPWQVENAADVIAAAIRRAREGSSPTIG